MARLIPPTGHRDDCECDDCYFVAVAEQAWQREGVARCYCGSYVCDGNHPDPSRFVPEVPDLLVPIYDAPESADQIGRDGWYRHFSSLIENGEGVTSAVICQLGKKDVGQIRSEIVAGSPVTGTVTFRMVDDVLVAQLVSYTAFA